MRGKRSKQYRKLMQQYAIGFGFREPYQVILDAEILKDAGRFKMDLVRGLEKALHGKVKPMVTQCSMRHLYAAEPRVPDVVEQAKGYERRRCGHHTLEEPLSTLDCLSSVVDPKGSGTNKHRYVVASQDVEVRAFLRRIPGVPLLYISRSVLIMEPMASATEDVRERDERKKLRSMLKDKTPASQSLKRKRDEDAPTQTGDAPAPAETPHEPGQGEADEARPKKKKKQRHRGPKGPNPLSVKKPKKREGNTGPKRNK